jgi:hypothetical protein
MKYLLPFLPFFVLLSGCSTPTAVLHDDAGHSVTCTDSGWGLIGGAIAKSHVNDCVIEAHKLGYHD